jgi:hypothetical protein
LSLQFEQDADIDRAKGSPIALSNPLTVHLVVAATASEDISWTSRLQIPGLEVIHYVADDPSAPYHPPANKGREAIIYHTYFHDFYDQLPDIVLLTHAQEILWHLEPLLSYSLTQTISNLDTLAVQERGYTNLRISWQNACPDHINTTHKGTSGLALEEQSTHDAFLGSFGRGRGLLDEVPEILAQPCCSQFAVTRAAIRSVPREQYTRFIYWLLASDMDDYMLGRTWEHMFQWLFAKKAVDCPIEWKAYCQIYHICFKGKDEYEKYMALENEKAELIDKFDVGIVKTVWNRIFRIGKKELVREIREVTGRINRLREAALERGKDKLKRVSSRELYVDD